MARLHVAVGVIRNPAGEILISRRRADAHQGGLWEFPGGKVEPGETVQQALQRELHEELGIDIGPAHPLIEVSHDYSDKSVLLDVWLIDEFVGAPRGREGQPLAWCSPDTLRDYAFPGANVPIVDACVRLPERSPA